MRTPSRILVLGATGMLGHEAVRVLGEDFDVVGTARDPDRAARLGVGCELYALEAGRPAEVGPLLDAVRPDAVLNAVGLVKQLEEASRPVPAITVNSLFPHELAAACAQRSARLVQVSTDCVFSGELPAPGRYTEDDHPDATDLYGRTKLLGEVDEAPALTLRTSIIGWELERASGLLEWLASQAGQSIRGFANALFSGLTTTVLARVVGQVMRETPDLAGVHQVSAEPISKLDLVTMLDAALELGCQIEPVEEPRINRSLDSSRFREATGIEIPRWEAMVGELAKGGLP